MTASKQSQPAARRRGELHHAGGDRRVSLQIEADRHQNASGFLGRASLQDREGRRWHARNDSLAL
jgi:hypothetical protein